MINAERKIICIENVLRQNMMSGFPNFGPMYPSPGGQGNLGPPPSPSHSQQHQQQQQTIVITENPNIRKIRSASTENTMPEGKPFNYSFTNNL